MTLTSINAPFRIGRATVLPGDLVLAKTDGVIFIPAILAEQAIISAEFTNLEDAFNFELNRLGKNGAEFEGGWTPAKYDALARWIDEHPEKLKMSRAQFNSILEKKKQPRPPRRRCSNPLSCRTLYRYLRPNLGPRICGYYGIISGFAG